MKKLFAASLCALLAVCFASNVRAEDSQEAQAQKAQALSVETSEDALIAEIAKPGDEPQDILYKNVAVKRLAVVGTEKAIPTLVAMLPNEKLNFNARFALEAMPFAAVDEALAKAANELTGKNLVGVIDTIGVRGKVESVAQLKELGDKNDDESVKKAVFAALGAIGTDECADYLVAQTDKVRDTDASVKLLKRGLGDAILEIGNKREKAGDLAGAIKMYDAATNEVFPSFVQDAGFYRALLCSGKDAAPKVLEALKLGAGNSKADVALKTVREYGDEAGAAVTKALTDAFNDYPEAMQVRIARAIGDRKDVASSELARAKLGVLAKAGTLAVKVAAAQALAKNGLRQAEAFDGFASDVKNFDMPELSDAIVAMAVSFDSDDFDAAWKKVDLLGVVEKSENAGVAYLKIAELRRTAEFGDALVKIAETKKGALRDGALNALSEIVDLDNLELLVKALDGEADDAKVDWLLRAACTRLPREDCAAKVAELCIAADLDAKIKMLPLLKQIGGGTALMAVAEACNNPQTLDKASQILGEWNTPEDATALAEICLAMAKQATDAKYHARGIRGYIRVARQFELPVATKIEMCKTAFETAKRAEDKALIFEVFKRKIDAENVAAALEYVKYDEYKDAACEAAVFVAEKIRESQRDWDWKAATDDQAKAKAGKILVEGMQKVVDSTSNADLKARAQKLL